MFSRVVKGCHYDELTASTVVDATPGAVEAAVTSFRVQTACEPVRLLVIGPADSHEVLSGLGIPTSVIASQYDDPDSRVRLEIHGVGPGASLRTPLPQAVLVEPASRPESGAAATLIATAEGDPGAPFETQFDGVFEQIDRAMRAVGMGPNDLVRTWFYVDEIHRHYEELNSVRDRWFDRWSIGTYPASTGIGGRPRSGALVSAVAEAVTGVEVKEVTTARQLSPSDYGSRFVRANHYARNGCDVVNISGISSIDEGGRSLRTNDETAITHCLSSFCDLLSGAGMEPADLQSFYVYGVSGPVAATMRDRAEQAGFPAPAVTTIVDVCRPDLRIEIEGRAVRRST